jgi:hypothetical protein
MTTNLEIDRSINCVYGKYNGGDFAFNFEVDDYELTLKDETFYDANDDPIVLQPQVLKSIKQEVHEWFIQQDDWHELTEPSHDAYEWHQQALEDERMDN